jgi:hypothetical protein
VLPEWGGERDDGGPEEEEEEEAAVGAGVVVGLGKRKVVQDVSWSEMEVEREWVRVCAFERCGGQCVRPSGKVLLEALRALVVAARADGVLLAAAGEDVGFWNRFAKDEELPYEFVDALRNRLFASSSSAGFGFGQVLASWVALLLLEAAGPNKLDRMEFMSRWKETLPEEWASEAKLELIKDLTDQSDPMEIGIKARFGGPSSKSAASTSARKWHERLKKGR